MADPFSEIEGLNSLDPQSVTEIHNRYYPEIFKFARFRVTDEVIAEDIAGDVFMYLLEAVSKNKGPTTNLRGWLLRTTANVVNNYFRKIYHRPAEDPTDIYENSRDLYLMHDGPDVMADKAERRRQLQLALGKLTEAQKMVITLRFGNRFSLEDTAIIMGKNANTIKAIQYRALVSLRKLIGNDGL